MHDNFMVGFGTGWITCGLMALICGFVLVSSDFTAILLAVGFMESWIGLVLLADQYYLSRRWITWQK